ncbi:hypothetical protein C0993_001976 [Termitomyces sp. T159_Od127]|nr:hypothetical protein C0993_001976 [Termitomyces sp. T159_Od127]
MASVKIATLIIRVRYLRQISFTVDTDVQQTIAKPISSQLKAQAKHAIENGANALAEGFLFTVAAALIIGESWRSSQKQSKRRDDVDDQLDSLGTQVTELTTRVKEIEARWEDEMQYQKQRYVCRVCRVRIESHNVKQCFAHRNDELSRILQRIVEIGLRGGWAEFEGTPLQIPRIQLNPTPADKSSRHTPVDSPDTTDTPKVDSPSASSFVSS